MSVRLWQKIQKMLFELKAIKLVLQEDRKVSEIAVDLGIATSAQNIWGGKAKASDPDLHTNADIYLKRRTVRSHQICRPLGTTEYPHPAHGHFRYSAHHTLVTRASPQQVGQ